jgi:hypothetical protein
MPNKWEDQIHELWLIYCQLKDAETDLPSREELITSARGRLGYVVNALHRVQFGLNHRLRLDAKHSSMRVTNSKRT